MASGFEFFNTDGVNLLEQLIIASETNERNRALYKTFHKYGLTVAKGLAMLLEVSTILGNDEREEE